MFKKIHTKFKHDIKTIGEDIESTITNKVEQASHNYAAAIKADKLSLLVGHTAIARLQVEEARLLYVFGRIPMPESVEDYFNMANRSCTHLMYEYLGENWDTVLEETMKSIVESKPTENPIYLAEEIVKAANGSDTDI